MKKTFIIVLLSFLSLLACTNNSTSTFEPTQDKTDEPTQDKTDEVTQATTESFDVIHFADPNFEAAVREIIGKDIGEIMQNDVADIIELKINELNIADLSGIEYFTALEWLDCSYNELTELDVSNNLSLTSLDCDDNNFPNESAIISG